MKIELNVKAEMHILETEKHRRQTWMFANYE